MRTSQLTAATPEEAKELLRPALISPRAVAAESFGHINYKQYVDRFVAWLEREGAIPEAVKSQRVLYQTLSTRVVRTRGVRKDVLEGIKKRLNDLKEKR